MRVWLAQDRSSGFALWFEVKDGIVGITYDGELHALYDLRIDIVVDALERSTEDSWKLL